MWAKSKRLVKRRVRVRRPVKQKRLHSLFMPHPAVLLRLVFNDLAAGKTKYQAPQYQALTRTFLKHAFWMADMKLGRFHKHGEIPLPGVPGLAEKIMRKPELRDALTPVNKHGFATIGPDRARQIIKLL